MVLKQQSNSLQEGPRNPFTANGTGWHKGGCTHDLEENRRALLPSCTLAPRLPWAGFSGTRTAHPRRAPSATSGPHMAARNHHPPWLGTQLCPPQLALHQAKDKGSCQPGSHRRAGPVASTI